MSRQFKKTKSEADRFDPEKMAQHFLNAVHGFETSDKNSKYRTKFATLVKSAVDAKFIKPSQLKPMYGIDPDAVRKGRDTGVSAENRTRFIAEMKEKAELILG